MSDVLVNNVCVTEHEIHLELQYHPAPHLALARHEATRALVVRELLVQEAQGLGMLHAGSSGRDLVDAALRDLTQAQVPVPAVNEQECEAYYSSNQAKFRGPELLEASHILFSVDAKSPTLNDVKSKAESVLEEVLRSPNKFESIARVQSACPSGSSGGRLGQISPGETLPEFEDALAKLQPGETCSTLVQTRHGLHIVRLENRAPVSVLPFHAVKDKILIYLRDRAWRQSVRRYIAILASKATISGFDLDSTPPQPTVSESEPRAGAGVLMKSHSEQGRGASSQGAPRRLPVLN